jgi:hypothetical protein
MPALQPGKTGHDAGEDAERNQRRIKADAPGSERSNCTSVNT